MARPALILKCLVVPILAIGSGCGDEGTLNPVLYEAELAPTSLDFGSVVVGTSEKLEVVLRNSGEGSLSVSNVESGGEFLLRELAADTSIAPGAIHTAEVLFEPTERGERSRTIRVLTRELDPLELTVRGKGVDPPRLEAEPNRLDFGLIDVGEEIRAYVTLTNTGEVDAVLSEARFDTNSFVLATSLPISIAPQATARIEVIFRPARAGDHDDSLKLSGPAANTPLIVLEGRAQESRGGLACDPTAYDFGEVERGQTKRATIECRATGAVRFMNVELPGDPAVFVIPQAPVAANLSPGQFLNIVVEFRSEGPEDAYESTLTVRYSGQLGARSIAVELEGRVIPPPPTETAVSIVLTWGSAADLDLHFVRFGGIPFADDGSDCHYGYRTPDWGVPEERSDDPFLDRDDVDGFGPEAINLLNAAQGDYDVYVHYFAQGNGQPATAELALHVGGELAGTLMRQLSCRQLWHVGTIRWNGSDGTFVQRDSVIMTSQGLCTP